MRRLLLVGSLSLVALLMLAPVASAQDMGPCINPETGQTLPPSSCGPTTSPTVTATPSSEEVGVGTPTASAITGSPTATALPGTGGFSAGSLSLLAAALLAGSGVLSYAIMRRG
jgi:hypothetical protein